MPSCCTLAFRQLFQKLVLDESLNAWLMISFGATCLLSDETCDSAGVHLSLPCELPSVFHMN